MSSIIAGTSIPTGFVVKTDSTGTLQIKTGPSSLTALSIDTAQNVSVNDASKFKIPGGSSGQVLATDGSGNLSWVDGGIGNTGVILTKYIFTATANQIIFTGLDDEGKSFIYSVGNLIVTKNGLCTNNYNANNGVAVVLSTPCSAGDKIIIYAFKRFVLADMVPASTGGTFNGSVRVQGSIQYTGQLLGNGSGLTNLTTSQITNALGYTPYNVTNPSAFITGIDSSMVTTALGYTPYNASNPNSYITSAALAPYATTASLSTAIPVGIITLWYGSTSTIPNGWKLCDGNNGTPDLRDRFVVGSGNNYGVGATGGSKDATLVSHGHTASSVSTFNGDTLSPHTHSINDPGHNHVYKTYGLGVSGLIGNANTNWDWGWVNSSTATTGVTVNIASAGTPSGSVSTSTVVSSVGSSATNANLPPYYALCYIMKV